MDSMGIVEPFDVIKKSQLHLFSTQGLIQSPALTFERSKERFHVRENSGGQTDNLNISRLFFTRMISLLRPIAMAFPKRLSIRT